MSGALQKPDGTEKAWKHGKTVDNGRVRFTSVSALELADSCGRKWKYRYQFNRKSPETDATKRGNENHAAIARYFHDGERGRLGPLVINGFSQLPRPRTDLETPFADLKVELDMVPDLPDGSSGLAIAKLRAGDIPVVGAIDLLHFRQENYGVQDPSQARDDDPRIAKIIDHKFPGDCKNAKAPHDLPKTLQMAGYAEYVFETYPDVERVRLTHNYFPVRGTPRAPTILVDREQVRPAWERARALGVLIKDIAREANPDLVDANTKNCFAYGQPCPAIDICRAAKSNTNLKSLVGASAHERLLKRPSLPIVTGDLMTATNPLAARLSNMKSGQPQTEDAPAITAPATTPPPPSEEEVQAEMKRLAAEETDTESADNPVVRTALAIEAIGIGMPQVSGDIIETLMTSKRFKEPVGAGFGVLADYAASSLEDLEALLVGAQELIQVHGSAAKVYEAAGKELPVETKTEETPPAGEKKPEKEKKQRAPRKKKGDAEAKVDEKAPSEKPDPEPEPESKPVETPVETASNDTVVVVNNAVIVEAQDDKPGPTPQPPGAINVHIDVAMINVDAKNLWPVVYHICENMNIDAAGGADATDFRCSETDRYKYNKWKGVLSAALRECPSMGLITPGDWVLNGSMSELGSVVVETMRQIAIATGGKFIQGAR